MKTPLKQTMGAGLIKAAERIISKKTEQGKKTSNPTRREETVKKAINTVKGKTTTSPVAQKKSVSKKTAYDIKEASNPKLKASARKHYAMNAEASMKNKKKK